MKVRAYLRNGAAAMALLLLCCLLHSSYAALPTFTSGAYGPLLVARHPKTEIVTGYYRNQASNGNCIFYLSGKMEEFGADIETFFPTTPSDIIKGRLTVVDEDTLIIDLKEEPNGCASAEQFTNKNDPATLKVGAKRPEWKEINIIRSKQANFFGSSKANPNAKKKLTEGDGVGLIKVTNNFATVEYIDGENSKVGWIRLPDLFWQPTDDREKKEEPKEGIIKP